MLDEFFEINTFHILPEGEGVQLELVAERLRGETLNFDLADGDKVIVEAGKRITARHVKQLEQARASPRWQCRTTTWSAASCRTT